MRAVLPLLVLITASPFSASATPGFVTLDRSGGGSHAGAELSIGAGLPNSIDIFVLNLYGQHIMSGGKSPSGIDFKLSAFYLADSRDIPPSLSAPEIGLFKRFGKLIFRLGFTLPTASKDNGIIARVLGALARSTDLALAAPKTMWLRPSVSTTFSEGVVFSRFDLGLDVPLGSDYEDDPALRFNGALGIKSSSNFSMTVEFTNVLPFSDGAKAIKSLALSARFHTGTVEPYVAYVKPTEDFKSLYFVTLGLKSAI